MQRSFVDLAQPLLFKEVLITHYKHDGQSGGYQIPRYIQRCRERLQYIGSERISPIVTHLTVHGLQAQKVDDLEDSGELIDLLFTTLPMLPNLCVLRADAIDFNTFRIGQLYQVPRLQTLELESCSAEVSPPHGVYPRSALKELTIGLTHPPDRPQSSMYWWLSRSPFSPSIQNNDKTRGLLDWLASSLWTYQSETLELHISTILLSAQCCWPVPFSPS